MRPSGRRGARRLVSRSSTCRHELELVTVGPRSAPRAFWLCSTCNLAFDEEPSLPAAADEYPRSSEERHEREDAR